jgi:hypothetical protein
MIDAAHLLSCDSGPALYVMWKRFTPSAVTVPTILRATVSGDPT